MYGWMDGCINMQKVPEFERQGSGQETNIIQIMLTRRGLMQKWRGSGEGVDDEDGREGMQ